MGEWTRERHEQYTWYLSLLNDEAKPDERDILAEIERLTARLSHADATAANMKRHGADALQALAEGRNSDAVEALFALCALLPQPTDDDLPCVDDFGAPLTAAEAMRLYRHIPPEVRPTGLPRYVLDRLEGVPVDGAGQSTAEIKESLYRQWEAAALHDIDVSPARDDSDPSLADAIADACERRSGREEP